MLGFGIGFMIKLLVRLVEYLVGVWLLWLLYSMVFGVAEHLVGLVRDFANCKGFQSRYLFKVVG